MLARRCDDDGVGGGGRGVQQHVDGEHAAWGGVGEHGGVGARLQKDHGGQLACENERSKGGKHAYHRSDG